MDRKRVLLITLVPVLLLILTVGYMDAQGPDPQAEPRGVRPNTPAGAGFTYQGRLKDSGGNPIDDTCDFTFSLWDAPITGTQVGADSVATGVSVTDGYFAALVNSAEEFGAGAFAGEERWLEVAVQCAADPSPVTLNPRQRLSAAPYALYSLSTAPHDHWGESWSGTGIGLTLTGGTVGLRGSAAQTGVFGAATALAGITYGLRGESSSTEGRGVIGVAGASSGTTYGIQGSSSSTDGRGVYGWAGASSGTTYGVYGLASSPEGCGVYGQGSYMGVSGLASAASGTTYAVYGRADSTSAHVVAGHATATTGPTRAVVGRSDSNEGWGVYGYTTAISGPTRGVVGQSDSNEGWGVYGYTTAISGTTYGVYGQSSSSQGYGVYGYASSTASGAITYGVYGESGAAWGGGVWGRSRFLGVLGHATDTSGHGTGVAGATAASSGAGVYGEAVHSAADYGVYSYGAFAATGTKSAIVGTQDYGWRHLYTMESPDVLFEDVGTAQLMDGRAVVAIDPVFGQTVNLEQPYQVFLTPLGDCGLYVAEQTANSFTVRALDGKSCAIAFHYRIIAKRLGYEDTRLAPAEDPNVAPRPLRPPTSQEVRP